MCQVSRLATFRNYTGCDERQERWLLELLATESAVARGAENHKSEEARRAARCAVRSASAGSARVAATAPATRCECKQAYEPVHPSLRRRRTPTRDGRGDHAPSSRGAAGVVDELARSAADPGCRYESRLSQAGPLEAVRSGRSAARAVEANCVDGKWSARAREGRRPRGIPGRLVRHGGLDHRRGAEGLSGAGCSAGARLEMPRGSTSAVA